MSTYKTGTVSVTNGSATVTGSGTAWSVALVAGGMFSSAGIAVPIASVGSDTSITLDYPWPGTTASGAAYSIALENSSAASVVNLQATLSRVLVTLSLAGITPNSSGSLTDRAALTLTMADKGYLFLRAEIGVAFAFYRWTGTAWDGPFAVGTGVVGGGVNSVVAGDGVAVDATNPAIPVISINLAGQAQGDILYRGSAAWQRLAKGTALQTLRQNSALTAPEWAASREVLSATRTYYVRTDGNDANTGLVNSAGGAFLTIQKAINVVAALDLSIYSVVIQVGNGTYTGNVGVFSSWVGSGSVTLQGDIVTPSNVVLSVTSTNAIQVSNGGRLLLGGFKIQTTTSGVGIFIPGGSVTIIGKMEYGACAQPHIQLGTGGSFINSGKNYTISGSASSHIFLDALSYAQIVSSTITLTGTPAFSAGFVSCSDSFIQCNANTFVGSGTGPRYSATVNGAIQTFGSGATYLPGNAAGSIATQGQYI
ncbi:MULTISPECIES: hypothetical protein [unclassified Mesorhizobium]|uniref:hypothetical protein n=1 Tax=unclassified Mesorhizobium TaxID=325217 RepID=UPI000FD9057D|nr:MULTISPECIES: hypothetical protein [unclassified Mesorhizobium]TGR58248.1 hypothetical protein EN842_01260 [bacterium M00.F.Ca.ET.199.01.1.1]TGU41644.1 hypothetical protein EN799_03555 [bacterium M00.F.Ca.ET.156.01.1.1]TGV89732.1 hypothetical protein EN792_006130 [Mesorhizobium sp. M00.F.Ca.ET.149.01.1.1]TGR32990.1 hypothetical protein EN840_01260 [Mesorhizobium sp. M8A.F.Ca.ET.197.01.1.1]TGR34636.1 hypothetical protein EN845_01260 [Mesorhizobium sp. M8A.F.Ca.ET.202.01.1.1]